MHGTRGVSVRRVWAVGGGGQWEEPAGSAWRGERQWERGTVEAGCRQWEEGAGRGKGWPEEQWVSGRRMGQRRSGTVRGQ